MTVIYTMWWVILVSASIGAVLILLSEFISKYSMKLYKLSLVFFGVVALSALIFVISVLIIIVT